LEKTADNKKNRYLCYYRRLERVQGRNEKMDNQTMGDKELINDSLTSQKMISSTYNTFANECVNPALRSDFLNILKEEHDIQADLFCEMQKRGWYQTKPAQQSDIDQSKQKYSV